MNIPTTISVIIPIYKAEKFLEKCLDSLVNQTLQPYEIILVNDGSPDKSDIVAQPYISKYPYIKYIEQSNQGVSAARNTGISISTGNWITFCDPDDYVLPNYIEEITKAINENNLDFYQIQYSEVGTISGKHESNKTIVKDNSEVYSQKDILNNYKILGSCSMWMYVFKKSIIEEFGIIVPPGVVIAEDEVFLIRYIKHINAMVKINQTLYVYYRHENSITKSIWNTYNRKAAISYKKVIDIMLSEWSYPYPPLIKTSILYSLTYHMHLHISCKEESNEIEENLSDDLQYITKRLKEGGYYPFKARKYLFYARNYQAVKRWIRVKQLLKRKKIKVKQHFQNNEQPDSN